MERELLKGHLDMLLLAVIAREPGHGYAITQNLKAQSEGAFDLAEGTLYPALHRLEQRKYLSSEWNGAGGRPRRVYRITSAGRHALVLQKATWSSVQQGVKLVMGAIV